MSVLIRIQKTPDEKYPFALNYQKVFKGGEKIDTSTVIAKDEATGSDVTSSLIEVEGVTFVQGSAEAGDTTRLIDSTKDFAALGIEPGHQLLNVTKNWRATVKEIVTTTNPFDTLLFSSVQAAPVDEDDEYAFFIARITLKAAGVSGKSYLLTWTTETTEDNVFIDSVRLQVRS